MANIDPKTPIFDTEHLTADLKGRSVRGGAVTLGAQAAKFVLGIGSTMVLARLLTPEDYGLIAMVAAITGFILLFKDMGLSMATVQRAEINHGQISTLFWINLALSLALLGVTAALAPVIAWFYGEPRLTYITLVISLGYLWGGLTVQHQALLRRQMRFGAIAVIDISSQIVGTLVGIFFAWKGFEYWSLVFMGLAGGFTGFIAVWITSGWLPGPPVRGSGVRVMLAFGGNLTGFNFLNYFARNLDNVLIGWYWGSQQLGMYSKAYNLLMLPIRQVTGPITTVGMPGLSSLQNESDRFCNYYLRMVSLIAAFTLPGVTFMALMSDEVIFVMLGEGWMESAKVFAILAVASILQPIYATTGMVHVAMGRSDRLMKYGLVSIPFIIASFVVGLPFGITGIAICYAVVNLFNTFAAFWYLSICTSIKLKKIWESLTHSLCVSFALGFTLAIFRYSVGAKIADLPLLFWTFLLSLLIWGSLNFVFFKNKNLVDAIDIFIRKKTDPMVTVEVK